MVGVVCFELFDLGGGELVVNEVLDMAYRGNSSLVIAAIVALTAGGTGGIAILRTVGVIVGPLVGIIWFVPLFYNTVMWRGSSCRISKDSALSQHKKTRTGLKI